jgi:hypothetical protein
MIQKSSFFDAVKLQRRLSFTGELKRERNVLNKKRRSSAVRKRKTNIKVFIIKILNICLQILLR